MPRGTSYVVRRGHALAFRIAVPQALRKIIGCRELVRTLRTGDLRAALPLALQMAANCTRLFLDIALESSRMDEKRFLDRVKEKIHKIDLAEARSEGDAQRIEHLREVKMIEHRVRAETLMEVARGGGLGAAPSRNSTLSYGRPLEGTFGCLVSLVLVWIHPTVLT